MGCLVCAKLSGLYDHIAYWLCELYLQCGSHICLAIYVYSAPCCMVHVNDFICGTYICIHLPCLPIKYLAYIPNLVGIFVSGTYVIKYETDIAFGSILVNICKNAGSFWPFSIMAV